MRLLFDHNVPGPLRERLPDHVVELAKGRGWGRLTNGELLSAVGAAGFGVLITADNHLRYQQNLSGRKIGVVVLPSQHMGTFRAGIDTVRAAIEAVGAGGYRESDLPRPPLLRRPAPGR